MVFVKCVSKTIIIIQRHLLELEGPGPFTGTTESNFLGDISGNLHFNKKGLDDSYIYQYVTFICKETIQSEFIIVFTI